MFGASKNERTIIFSGAFVSPRSLNGDLSNQRISRPEILRDILDVPYVEWKSLLTDLLGSAFDVRESIVARFLVRANQQVSELPAGCSRLRE